MGIHKKREKKKDASTVVTFFNGKYRRKLNETKNCFLELFIEDNF